MTTRGELYTKLQTESIQTILISYNHNGFVFEAICDILITLGMLPKLSMYRRLEGSTADEKIPIVMESIRNYFLGKINTTNDASDISLLDTSSNKYVFISCKYLAEYRNVYDLDISKINAAVKKYKIPIYAVMLAVKDTNRILDLIAGAKSGKDHLENFDIDTGVIDLNDLDLAHSKFKRIYGKIPLDNIALLQATWIGEFKSIKLRLGQEIFVEKAIKLLERHSIVICNCKARTGKTFMCAGLIDRLKHREKLKVGVILTMPNETKNQFTVDLFDKYTSNFSKFYTHELATTRKHWYRYEPRDHEIFVASKHFLDKKNNTYIKQQLKKNGLDLVFYDEKHFSGLTTLSKGSLSEIVAPDTKHIYMTATADKVIYDTKVPAECIIRWDIDDEAACCRHDIDFLRSKHGSVIDELLYRYGIVEFTHMMDQYKTMPKLNILTYGINTKNEQIINEVASAIECGWGFSPNALLHLNDVGDFKYLDQVYRILELIFGNSRHVLKAGSYSSFIDQIKRINTINKSRPPRDILMFLPEINIARTCIKLREALEYMRIVGDEPKQYNIICVYGDEDCNNLKARLKQYNSVNKCTIILAGKMLKMGVSLPTVDIVVMAYGGNQVSSDDYVQKMYRCMTEDVGKKFGYVIDLSPCRVINSCLSIQLHTPEGHLSPQQKIKRIIDYACINIYSDQADTNVVGNETINKLMDIYYDNPLNSIERLRIGLENIDIFINEEDITVLRSLELGNDESKQQIHLNSSSLLIPDGKLISNKILENCDNTQHKNTVPILVNVETTQIEEYSKQFKTILPDIILLACFATRKLHNLHTFEEKFNYFIGNETTRIMLLDHLKLKYHKDNIDTVINIFNNILSRSIYKSSHIDHMVAGTQSAFDKLLDEPDALIKFLESQLPPKETEKKQLGEVFTPVSTIMEMLDAIQNYYKDVYASVSLWRKYGPNIFSNPTIRWYDPAAGMGQFPAIIYTQLMKGLESVYKDPILRKKHILQHQLFMTEINAKNHYILTELFTCDGIENKNNIHLGSALDVNTSVRFGVSKFDIIIGNPPYNKEVNEENNSSANFYHKFIEYLIDKCRILSFIVPGRWLIAGNAGLRNFRKQMLQRKDIYSIKRFQNSKDIFKGVNIEGGICCFIKSELHNGPCLLDGLNYDLASMDVVIDSKYHTLINKVMCKPKIHDIYIGRHFKIGSNCTDQQRENTGDLHICYVSEPHTSTRINYIAKNKIKPLTYLDNYKVITPHVYGAKNEGFAKWMSVAKPGECFNDSYMGFVVSDGDQGNNLIKYLKLKSINRLLCLRKTTQNIGSDTMEWIPLPDLHIEWNDIMVYNWLNLTPDEIRTLESIPLKN
ncbi:putative adenine-specific methylase MPN-111 [Faustovirus]|nr:putative adenine-specific methylase MPN-111 [Faustovirus]QJX73502.1 putative adenine-specific methylase MPN-111 [Faustovirus]